MTEHSQEALIPQAYPHCRQAASCSKDAIFGKWCNSCKGSPRTFHLRIQAILKHATRYLTTLHCHFPIPHTSALPTENTLFKVLPSKKESDFTNEVKKCMYTSISKYNCPALHMKVTQHCIGIFWPLDFLSEYEAAWFPCWIPVKILKSSQS